MTQRHLIILIISLSFTAGCITQFKPEINETGDYLVVEGLISDQIRTNTIKIYRSVPLGETFNAVPVRGCLVTVTDEKGIIQTLKETRDGTYRTDSTRFRGRVGGIYTLKIISGGRSYVSAPMEMLPVPQIDSLYYEKELIAESNIYGEPEEGCWIYLNTYDPSQKCLYYRWDFTETWEFRIPFPVPKNRCWIIKNSDRIHIKNASAYNQARVTRYPLYFISNGTDRLNVKYSILVNQYSLSENEYNYWEKLEDVTQNTGGLYDMIPAALTNNIQCINFPDEIILGYFSVSAVSQKRLFVQDRFQGLPYLYQKCLGDTVWATGDAYIPGLNDYIWIIEDYYSYKIVTKYKDCADCTTRGTTVMPSYWGQ